MDISELSRLAGVSSRTLRHYDAIGLLPPAWTSADGRRHYGDAELIRLQHILVLRELDVPLDTIGRLVDTDDPRLTASSLRDHHAALVARRDRLTALAATVETTLTRLEKGVPMTADDMFEGFDHAAYEPEARERWGDDAVERSRNAWSEMGSQGQEAHLGEHVAIASGMAQLAASGQEPAGEAAQSLVAGHYAWVSRFWIPNAEAYTALGAMYVEDPRFRATYDEYGEGTAAFLAQAMAAYAATLEG